MGQAMAKSLAISALGLDIGRRRIGVAGCDGTGLIATELTTLERRNFAADMAALQDLVQARQATVLVIGLPYTLQGELGFQAKQVQRYAGRLSQVLQMPVDYVDERCTSIAAEQIMVQQGRSPSRNKGLIDRKAAAIILQQWLDNRRQTPTLLPPDAEP